MNPDVKEKAEALADALAGSPEYKNFVDARENLEKHEAAKIMLRDFQMKQMELQQKVLAGQQLSETDTQDLENAYQLVAFNPYVRRVIEAEAAFGEMLAQVQKILGEAVGMDEADEEPGRDDSGPAASDGDASADGDRPDSGSSRLWVPGR